MVDSLFKNNFRKNIDPGKTLPRISTGLDSVRTYQFEVRFEGLPQLGLRNVNTDLTLAAKQVGPIGISVEDIVVDRVNDRAYYPGRPNQDELTIAFDNLYMQQTSPLLWQWFKSIYDPITGNMTELTRPGGSGGTFKIAKLTIMELDNTKTPHAAIELLGVYPKSIKFSEKNYSTNDFSTIEVSFRWDFIDYYKYASGRV